MVDLENQGQTWFQLNFIIVGIEYMLQTRFCLFISIHKYIQYKLQTALFGRNQITKQTKEIELYNIYIFIFTPDVKFSVDFNINEVRKLTETENFV